MVGLNDEEGRRSDEDPEEGVECRYRWFTCPNTSGRRVEVVPERPDLSSRFHGLGKGSVFRGSNVNLS